ncbi:circularly permuted type 2 ATP-grasp protein [Desulfobacter curvatus]|uniref:circularly permuted type 2 ATP-grasp protein n=1 Tax=Desulfobacter curvatus TaxID=2290 RepID=UPI00036B89F0|nr:circularly permuted type 2 ATP-grasp protein [Desulfobacter curvatus]
MRPTNEPIPGDDPGPSGAKPVIPVFTTDILNRSTAVDLSSGKMQPPWDGLAKYLNSLGTAELSQRWKKARQIIHEHGSAYNVFNPKTATERPWALDPIPLPISSHTWQTLEHGIQQRTKLLALIFKDIYGRQDFIRNRLIPAELIFGNPGFLRQCRFGPDRVTPDHHLFSSDLICLADGRWQVASHGTQAPAGTGYALENRVILTRILPRMFHYRKVQRLAPFFKYLNLSLMEISGQRQQEPRIVMLCEGPSGTHYFEQVFLARYLGYTLVEANDLTTRGDWVFLKTLGGLQRVDVILRQIPDYTCDPLLGTSQAFPGIPGLVQAVRAGNVAISNSLGSGVLESPGLFALMPELCRDILGEPLILENTDSFWLGIPETQHRVVEEIKSGARPITLYSAFSPAHTQVVHTRSLTGPKKQELITAIQATPYAWAGRYPVEPFTVPVWSEQGVKNRYTAVRMFSSSITENAVTAAAKISDQVETAVMSGGLARVANDPEALVLSGTRGKGQGAKDVWCLSERPTEFKSMLHRFSTPFEIHRGSDLPSRVADNMLWLGRYMERTEGMLRVIRSVLMRVHSETQLDKVSEMPFFLRAMANLKIISEDLGRPDASFSVSLIEKELYRSIYGVQIQSSILNCLNNAIQVADRVRDRLSDDSWQIFGRIEKGLVRINPKNQSAEILEMLSDIILNMSAFAGLALESMTRGMGWRFMDMGRRIERALHMTTVMSSLIQGHTIPNANDLEAVLEVADSRITYHTRYRTTIHMEPLVDLLLLDEINPRSVGFQLAALHVHLENLPRSQPFPFRTKEEKIILDLTTRLRLADTQELMTLGQKHVLPNLDTLLEKLNNDLQEFADSITQHYLSRIETEKQLNGQFENKGIPVVGMVNNEI